MALNDTVPDCMVNHCNVFGSRADSSMLEEGERGLLSVEIIMAGMGRPKSRSTFLSHRASLVADPAP